MISDISNTLAWLENNLPILKNINRGIERETLRVKPNGDIAVSKHPIDLGSALQNEWITTDFAESLLEFITPVDNRIEYMLYFLRDIHRYVYRILNKEFLWPLSMPCRIEDINKIKLADYGKSNIGLMKTLYRKGLKTRYGAMMQTISGIHYNFSLPVTFWKEWADLQNLENCKETISAGYLILIRNYYRFGWIIPYLFGASPAICSSFLQKNNNIKLIFEINNKNTLWLPYATSLRLSDLGYNNKVSNILKITFNSLEEYVNKLRIALKTPWEQFVEIGIKDKYGNRIQLNTNILQIENEFYSPIRPKCVNRFGKSYSDTLLHNGIEYIEVRSLDINPFSAIGINKTQVYFLDLFLIWCILSDISDMSTEELHYSNENWKIVTLEGRKPNLKINVGFNKKYFLADIGKKIFHDLRRVAEILDKNEQNKIYQKICDELFLYFDNPELTYSARILNAIKQNGVIETGISLSKQYRDILCTEPLNVLQEKDLKIKAKKSILEQKKIEKNDFINFETYLNNLSY
ncbi:glutamate--cysteine ligase [Pantoea sp. SoEX]|uniref:glutamate--cysteine ligase n=1 Tax=Pantoea sp. SoEX TaxID=2576763 RepID=UPI00135862EB|nr:glutamate--cysteine ligase [Pantoea sp. SoEX]MXP51239.1 glutamate--cysteine ligase [Pantoea sp. SoEX]